VRLLSDLRGPEADWFPPEIREPLIAAGFISQLLIPFGVADAMLGFMVVERLEYRPWTPAEVHTAQLVTADIGRAVHLARLYERERRLVAELKDVNQAKSSFLAAVSHELRTPLTSIVGYLEMLRDGEAGPLLPAQEKMLTGQRRCRSARPGPGQPAVQRGQVHPGRRADMGGCGGRAPVPPFRRPR
jgi:signal transduction histidine kinase